MIYRPMSDPVAEQQRAYEVYGELCDQFHREPWNMEEALKLIGIVPDDTLIRACIAWYGTSKVGWEFGHIYKQAELMARVWGDALLPYLKYYIAHPVHGGGTAYGKAYLEDAKLKCVLFCEKVLEHVAKQPDFVPLPFEDKP